MENCNKIYHDIIQRYGLIAILRSIPIEQIEKVGEALIAGGIHIIECPFDQTSDNACLEMKNKLERLNKISNPECLIGAGTVLTLQQLDCAYQYGAKIIISPNVDEKIIRKTKELGLISAPGAFSPTDVVNAKQYGADYVKLFPAGNIGPEYIKAIKAPLSNVKIFAVGGITLENMQSYLEAGADGLGIGNTLFPMNCIEEKNYEQIKSVAINFVNCYNKYKADQEYLGM